MFDAFADHFRERRAASGLTQKAIARHFPSKTGGMTGCVWNWENGATVPTRVQWAALQPMLGLSDEWGPLIERVEADREVTGRSAHHSDGRRTAIWGASEQGRDITAPATPEAVRWQGWGSALKPAHEPIICARKPLNVVPLDWQYAGQMDHALGGLVWLSLSPAKRAELASPSSRAERHGAMCGSALARAAMGTSPGASGATAMFSSPAMASTCLSIAGSWSAILAGLSAQTITSTTTTRSSTTTVLRTLSSLLDPVISLTTMPQCGCLLAGDPSTAASVASSSSADWSSWIGTLSRTAPASAIEGIALAVASVLASAAAESSGDQAAASSAPRPAPTGPATTGAERQASPAHEPIVLARKPLIGTIAANVLAYGTGALNVDACRVSGVTNSRRGGDLSNRVTALEGGDRIRTDYESAPGGRWPPNLLLSHSPGCVQTGTRQVRGDARTGGEGSRPGGFGNVGAGNGSPAPSGRLYGGADGLETVPAWTCAEGCPVALLDAQSGTLKSGKASASGHHRTASLHDTGAGWRMRHDQDAGQLYGDQGGASRYFPQFSWDSEHDVPFRYVAKASSRERNQGLGGDAGVARNSHPT